MKSLIKKTPLIPAHKTLLTAIATASLLLNARADITTGLVGHWTLRDGPGSSTAADTSGNANNGTLTGFTDGTYNNMWTTSTDPINVEPYAILFNAGSPADGTDAYVSVPDSASLDLPSSAHSFTLAAWVNCSVAAASEPANAGIIAKGFLNLEEYALYMSGGRFVAIQRNTAGTGSQTVTSTIIPAANTWYHVAVTFTISGGANKQELLIYINGVLNDFSPQNTYTTVYDSAQPLSIGCRENTTAVFNLPFQGIIDQVFVYDRTLSASDVLQLYQNASLWDPNGTKANPGSGGSGNWDSSTLDWWDNSGSSDIAWAANTFAYFEGSAGTVTLNNNETADGLMFTTAGYTINQGLSGSPVLTLAGSATVTGSATITVPAGITTINCPIAGTSGLTTSGAGTLVLGGANTYTGVTTLGIGTTVNCGSADLGTSGPLGAASTPGSIVLAGGTLQYSSLNNNDYSGRFSTAAGQVYNIDVNGQSVNFGTALSSSGSTLTLMDTAGGGTLNISSASSTIGANVTVNKGTLVLNSATAMSSGAILTLPNSTGAAAVVNLNFSGNQNIGALNFGATSMPAGIYGSSSSSAPAPNQYPCFAGTGTITVAGSLANSSYWDSASPINAYPGSGGSGTWSTAANWWSGAVGSDSTWTANNIANFAGTAGTVTLGAAESADGLTFITSGYTITGQTQTLTLNGSAPAIIVPNFGTETINCILAGSGLTFGGLGTLFLGGTNTFTGGITIPLGSTLQISNQFGAGGGTITDNGTLVVNIAANTLTNSVTGTGIINVMETVGDNLTLADNMSGFTGTMNCLAGPGGNAKAQISTAFSINPLATINIAVGGTFFIEPAVNNGATVIINGVGNNEAYGALRLDASTQSGPVILNTNSTIGNDNAGASTISGVISDGGKGFGITTEQNSFVLTGVNTYTGPTTISSGSVTISGSGSLGSGSYPGAIIDNGSITNATSASQTWSGLISGTGTLTQKGPGTLTLTDAANSYNGIVTISGGILDVPTQHPIGNGITTINFSNGGTLENDDTTSGDGFALSYALVMGTGGGVFSTPTSGQALLVPNLISGSGSLTKTGLGKITLSANNSLGGATLINAGTLALASTGSINSSPSISIAAGAAFDVSAYANYTWSSSTTLSASGTGTTMGSTAATIIGPSAGTVSLGAQAINLTFTPTTFIGDATHPALYISQGSLTLSANTISVNNASAQPLGPGIYTLISVVGGTISGAPNTSVSVTGSGVETGTAASIQVSGGNVNLVVASPVPGIIGSSVAASGANMIFNGTNGPDGGIYYVLTSTNVALPLSQWTPVATNTFSPTGTFSVTNAIGAGTRFFIIAVP